MAEPTTQAVKINGYHAHVYYDPTTRARAAQLRETIAGALGAPVPLKISTMRRSYRAEQYPTPR
jgi:aromatic ring-cleaving dioxygenase